MMAILWSIAGLFFFVLSCLSSLKKNKEWEYRYSVLALLNWIVYYLAAGNR